MFKPILVAVDSSETGELALQAAIGLATESQAQLRIVHVVDVANLNMGAEFPDHSSVSESLLQKGQDVMRNAETAVAVSGLECESSLITIDNLNMRIPEAIADDAETWPADLIVLGTHGRRGLSRLFLGSVAEGVVRVATKPVLLIPGK
ncbi:universal stress protein [Thiobacillus denitrificans]|uniref:UspA domain-containing protein n=1 Tax=Thiobacillus denitrificans TaxID=36861 RepID=A0A119CV77_THIDE|nr:universal stress protein [Thiobacillus denitrificans]KVW94383.1 hypothetical protein ABW22_13500 [Thiobacillus denitrificans]